MRRRRGIPACETIVAFQDDLRLLGLENRVMGMTMSEFELSG
jgi:hypothetical protein